MIEITKSCYHYTWVVEKNKVSVGQFSASEVIFPYQSPLCFLIGGDKFTSNELRKIADLLDEKNKEEGHV